jgi:glycosyltransferase involved in cell wall biosynthesis
LNRKVLETVRRSGAGVDVPASPMRVAILCDFLEEKWPSMDLAGDMLYRFLKEDYREIEAVQLRPDFQRRFTRLPIFGAGLGLNADRLANRFFDYPRWLRPQVSQFDLFHLVDHSYSQLLRSLPPERAIVTCHDLDTFRCLLEPEQEQRPRWFQAMARKILDGFQRAAHVICNSGATRDSLLHYRLFPAERLSVIHVGVHPVFTSAPNPAAEAEAARLLGPNSDHTITLLSVGSTIPRKRMDILLRVFAAVRHNLPSARLVRVGGPFTAPQLHLAKQLGVGDFISVLPFVSSEVLASIYRRADLLLQPSESEGFGMPITEAMACGCPVLASDLSVLREVGGAACSYCPVGDVDAWTSAVLGILRENAEDNGSLRAWRQRAQSHAARYSWTENARQTAQLYRRILQRLNRPSGFDALSN